MAPTALHEPLTLPCGQILPNRMMKAALSEALGDRSHAPSGRLETLYRRWGAGGYGLIITGNVMIDRSQLGEPGNIVVEDDRDLDGLARWAKTTRDGGAHIWMQINHPGRQANALAARNRPVSASAIAAKVPGAATPRALTGAEIESIIDRYVSTAIVAEQAGFNGVQIHGAHGYLVAQFLSPLVNQRTDEWGGDATKRMKFLLEIVRRMRNSVSPAFAVGVKLNSADFQRGGFSEAESREVIERLAQEGVDLIEISGGSYEAPAMLGKTQAKSTREREAYFLEYAEAARNAAADVPLAVTGGFRSRTAMIEAVASGACDVIGLGRPTITTPDAASHILDADAEGVEAHHIEVGLRKLVGRLTDLKPIDGVIDLQWHTDQMHRLGDGHEPDIDRPWWKTVLTVISRNGFGSFRTKRG